MAISHKDIYHYLLNYDNDADFYYAHGAIELLQAILKNLQRNYADHYFLDHGYILDEKDEAMLQQLVADIPKSRVEQLEREVEQERSFTNWQKQAREIISMLDDQEIDAIKQATKPGKLLGVKYVKGTYGFKLPISKLIVEIISGETS